MAVQNCDRRSEWPAWVNKKAFAVEPPGHVVDVGASVVSRVQCFQWDSVYAVLSVGKLVDLVGRLRRLKHARGCSFSLQTSKGADF
jgi:hypothetical protein